MFILNFDLTDGYRNLTEPLHVLPESEFRDDMILPEPEPDELVTDNGMLLLRGMGVSGTISRSSPVRWMSAKLYFRETMSAVMSRVICEMARAVLSDGNTDTVARTIDFIRENFARPITNRDIASNVNYHEFYVNKADKAPDGDDPSPLPDRDTRAGGEETAHLDLRACVEDRGVLRIRVGRVLHIRVRKGDRRHAERIQTSPRRLV